MSSSGTSLVSLMVSACEWQRIAPTRTHRPSIGIGLPLRPMILLASTCAFHSSLRLAGFERDVDPGNQVAGQRHRPGINGIAVGTDEIGHFAVDFKNRRGRIVDQRFHFGC